MSVVVLRIENKTSYPMNAFANIQMTRGRVLAFNNVQPMTTDIAIHTEEVNRGDGCAGVASFEAGQGTGNMITLSFATTTSTGDTSFSIAVLYLKGDLGRLFKVTAPPAPIARSGSIVFGTFIIEQFSPAETQALLQASAPLPVQTLLRALPQGFPPMDQGQQQQPPPPITPMFLPPGMAPTTSPPPPPGLLPQGSPVVPPPVTSPIQILEFKQELPS